jgi:hypothetical protein
MADKLVNERQPLEFGEVSSLIIRYQIGDDLSLRGMVVHVGTGQSFPFVGKDNLDKVLHNLMK